MNETRLLRRLQEAFGRDRGNTKTKQDDDVDPYLLALAAAYDSVDYATLALEEIDDPAMRKDVIQEARKRLAEWLADPETAGRALLDKLLRRQADFETHGWISPLKPLVSEHKDGLSCKSLDVQGDCVSWYDYYGEPIALVASLLAKKARSRVVLYDIHHSGNGHFFAKWTKTRK